MKSSGFACVVAVCLLLAGLVPGAQSKAEQMKDYSRVLHTLDLTLTIVHVNDVTVPILFQPPTLYSMRARAKETTVLYVQGSAPKDIEFDTTNFRIEQGGQTVVGVPTNITNFAKGNKTKIPLGGKVDGILVFPKLIDVSKSFTVKHDRDQVEFKFSGDVLKAITAAPPAPQ